MSEVLRTDLPHVMHETIEQEVVVVNLDNGTYYSFDGVGAQLWDWMGETGCSETALVAAAQARFDGAAGEIADGVRAFVAQLRDEQLVRVVSGEPDPGDVAAPATAETTPFRTPLLQKYTDMETLLLADPVHEVDEAGGWPKLK
ncbi:MAG: PqqD family protein [Alphaproteobacteria bacterium]